MAYFLLVRRGWVFFFFKEQIQCLGFLLFFLSSFFADPPCSVYMRGGTRTEE